MTDASCKTSWRRIVIWTASGAILAGLAAAVQHAEDGQLGGDRSVSGFLFVIAGLAVLKAAWLCAGKLYGILPRDRAST